MTLGSLCKNHCATRNGPIICTEKYAISLLLSNKQSITTCFSEFISATYSSTFSTTTTETLADSSITTPQPTHMTDLHNVAIKKETTLYPDVKNNSRTSFSVDGDMASCAESNEIGTHIAFWTLNLEALYSISRICIYTKENTCNYVCLCMCLSKGLLSIRRPHVGVVGWNI